MLKGKNILGCTLVLSLLSLGYSNSAQAFNITFDWNDFTYTAGSIDPVTYSDIQGSGIDLTIDVGGNTSGLVLVLLTIIHLQLIVVLRVDKGQVNKVLVWG